MTNRSTHISAPSTAGSNAGSACQSIPHAWRLLFALMVTIVGFRPIASDDFWWELSRGREVIRGSFTPSYTLLALETGHEADWLGGVPLFLVYALSGSSGLMLLRISAAMGVAWGICRVARGLPPAMISGLVFAGLIGAERAFDLGPRMFDALGIMVAFWMARDLTGPVTRRALLPLAILFVVWSNIGPRVAVGWVVLAGGLLLTRGTESRLSIRSILTVAAVAMCLTPRGVLTIRDSLHLVLPQLATESWALANSSWEPLLWSTWGAAEMVYLGLSCVLAALLVLLPHRRRDWRSALACCPPLLLPWISAGNLEQATIWTVLLIGGMLRESKLAWSKAVALPKQWAGNKCLVPFVQSTRRASSSQKVPDTYFPHDPKPQFALPWLQALGATVVVGVILMASGGPSVFLADMGWGLHSKLDNRLLSLALNSVEPHGTACTDNVRSAGMMCWLAPASLKIQDVPQRALLSGRWRQQQLIHKDLRLERQNTYWRDDGSQGGWWIPLRQRDTSLVVIDAHNTALIRGLEPSIWKPLSLDSTVIPYAAAGDPAYNDRLIEVLQQRELVNFGPWTYSPPISTRSEFDRDRFGFRTEIADPDATLRQARVFRAMRLHVAALKVLHALLPHAATADVRAEFATCQMELAHLEAVAASRPSQFRSLSLRETLRQTDRVLPVAPTLLEGLDNAPEDLLKGVELYVSGTLSQAEQVLTRLSPESGYAAACIAIEAGHLDAAATILRSISASAADPALALLIASRLEDLEGNP